ncbi:MAG: hypothetical protein HOV81_39310 [Kofleriaceae bacterium]|nr:hypothetical protein [Kofleriaceae bacterium]
MDRIRTLLLARTHVVVMDPDLVSQAATAPARGGDVEDLEDELAQLGFVLSLDLAVTLRRLPHDALRDLRGWICDTLATGTQRPNVPLAHGAPGSSVLLRRMQTWLATRGDQPCPWCGDEKDVGALDPCGHLACHACWNDASYAACPVCHRRVAREPFANVEASTKVTRSRGQLTVLHLGLDLMGMVKERFSRLVARPSPLSAEDRAEIEAVIDEVGDKALGWLPPRIVVRESMAIAVARLVRVGPDHDATLRELGAHLATATDVLRVACVLLGGDPGLAPSRLCSISRGLRRALLGTLERLPADELVEDMVRHRALWKRVGEKLHPFELARTLPKVALAFSVVRGTNLAAATFGPKVRELGVRLPSVYVEDDRAKPIAWAGPIEDALRAGNPRAALARLTHRPVELLRRADHLVRTAQVRQHDALQTLVKAVELAAMKGPPALLFTVAAHASRRGRPSPRRVFFPDGDVLRAWSLPDFRTPLRGDAIAVMVGAIRRQLVLRAETKRQFPRAIIDRALVDLVVPMTDRTVSRTRQVWPRGSEVALPDGPGTRISLVAGRELRDRVDLAIELFDVYWRHVATVRSDERAIAMHLEQLAQGGARHAVVALSNPCTLLLTRASLGVTSEPDARSPLTFSLRGRSRLVVPLTIDLAERRLRWLDIQLDDRDALREVGGYRAALAHVGRDYADLIGTHAKPTMWDVACIHAASRANTIYIRERDGSFTIYRHRDNENKLVRLGRLMSGGADDGRLATIPPADAPTWFALLRGMPLPRGSAGYALDVRGLPSSGVDLRAAGDLVAMLLPKS